MRRIKVTDVKTDKKLPIQFVVSTTGTLHVVGQLISAQIVQNTADLRETRYALLDENNRAFVLVKMFHKRNLLRKISWHILVE